MPADPLSPFLKNWQKRVAGAQGSGVNPEVFRPVFQMDFQRLMQGSQPFTNQEAAVALTAATGKPLLEKTVKKPNWNPLHLLGEAVGDIGEVTKMIPRIPGAMLKDITHIGEMPGAIGKGVGKIASGDVGEGLQEIAHAPGLLTGLIAADFIPGVNAITAPITAGVLAGGVAGQAMTPEGRKEITESPGITALNLLPAGKSLHLVGGVEKAGELSAGQLGRLERKAELSRVYTPEEIAAKQEANAAVRVPGIIKDRINRLPFAEKMYRKAETMQVGENVRRHLYGPSSDGNLMVVDQAKQFATENGIDDWLKLSPEAQKDITHAVWTRRKGETWDTLLERNQIPKGQISNESLESMAGAIRAQGDMLVSEGEVAAIPMGDGTTELFPLNSPVVRDLGAFDKRVGILSRHTAQADAAAERLAETRKAYEATLVNGEQPNIGKLVQDTQAELVKLHGTKMGAVITPEEAAALSTKGEKLAAKVVPRDVLDMARSRLGALTSPGGLLSNVVGEVERGNWSGARGYMSLAGAAIDRISRADPELGAQLLESVTKIDKTLNDFLTPKTGRLARFEELAPRLERDQKAFDNANALAVGSSKKLRDTYDAFQASLRSNPSARFMPAVVDEFITKMKTKANEMYSDDPVRLGEALKAIEREDWQATFKEAPTPAVEALEPFGEADQTLTGVRPKKGRSEPAAVTAPKAVDITGLRREARSQELIDKAVAENKIFPQADKVLKDTAKTWLEMREILDPVFIHKMSPLQAGKLPRINPASIMKPSVIKERGLDPSTSYLNLGFGLLRSQAEILSERISRDIVENHWVPHLTYDKGQMIERLQQRLESQGEKPTTRELEARLNAEYESFETSPFKSGRIKGSTDRVVHRDIYKQMTGLAGEGNLPRGFMKAYRKGMGMYFFAVTGLSPMHMAHVAFSTMFAGMTTAPDAVSVLKQMRAAKALGRGEEVGGETLHLQFKEPSGYSRELLDALLPGFKSQARLMAESNMPAGLTAAEKALWLPKKLQESQVKVDSYISQFGRAMEYMVKRKQGFDPEDALWEVGKVFSLHRGLNNIERSIMRNAIPFYSWSSYLIRFTLQFPVDHPIRAGIVANFAEAEQEDWAKGLPDDLAQMFFMGQPDKNGNSTAFDIRQISPLRDVGRMFTLGGLIGSLNPIAQGTLKSMGINTFSGTNELYSDLTVNPDTGKLEAKRGGLAGNLIESAVPQARGIEALLGWSDQMRHLAKTDPEAYRASIARSFHWPWMRREINLPQERARVGLNTFRDAQQAAGRALKEGDFSNANQFNVLPVQGQFLPPEILKKLYDLLQAKNTGFTPNTLLRR